MATAKSERLQTEGLVIKFREITHPKDTSLLKNDKPQTSGNKTSFLLFFLICLKIKTLYNTITFRIPYDWTPLENKHYLFNGRLGSLWD